MTIKEIENLEVNSNVRDLHSLTLLIELYCTDYAKTYADNTVKLLYFQTFKLIWNNLKTQIPSIANQNNILLLAEACKASPNRHNFEALIKSLKQYSENSTESASKIIRIINGVLAAISKNITQILNQSFGKYANSKIASRLTADFVLKPSYNSFSKMIDEIESFGNSHKELEAAKELLLSMLSYIQNSEIERFNDIKDSCYKWFQLTGTLKEYNFVQKLSDATDGNQQAMLETGKNYEEGNGVERDEYIAEEWYTKTLIAGNPNAHLFISNLNTKRHQRLIKEQYERKLSEQKAEFESLRKELIAERKKTQKLEQQRAEEMTRHNKELETLQRQVAETLSRLNTRIEHSQDDRGIKVEFNYRHVYRDGEYYSTKCDEETISEQTYNSLIGGGEYAIINYIRSNFCYLSDGEKITNARMRKSEF